MSSQEEVMRLVAELVDKYSVPLKQIKKAVGEMSKTSREANAEAAKAAREHAKHVKELHERFEKTKDFVSDTFAPALGALGITFFGIGEGLSKLTENLRKAGESWKTINDVAQRGKVTAGFVNAMSMAFVNLGIAPERAGQAIASFGEHMDRIRRSNPEELNNINHTFSNMADSISEALKGATSREDQFKRLMSFMSEKHFDTDQKRKWLEFFGLPVELATRSMKDIEEAIEEGLDFEKKHPTNMKVLKELDDAFTRMDIAIQGINKDLVNAFGSSAASMIDKFAGRIEHLNEEVKHLHLGDGPEQLANPNQKGGALGLTGGWQGFLDRLDSALGFDPKRLSPQDRVNGGFSQFDRKTARDRISEGFSAFGHGDKYADGYKPIGFSTSENNSTFKLISSAVTDGVLNAFREWMDKKSSGGGGYNPASYDPGGGGGGGSTPRFGSAEFPNLGDTPKSVQGTRARVTTGSRGQDVPAGSGPGPSGLKGGRREVAKIMADEWRRAGMSDAGIAGIMANVADESGFNPTLRHFDQPSPRFRGTEAQNAHGLYQEGGDEWNHYAAWLAKNHPGADWRDPRLQSRFAAENLKKNYPGVWQRMKSGNRFQAGAAYVDGYLKPAAQYRAGRINKYLRGGVAPLDSYTGGESRETYSDGDDGDSYSDGGGARLRDMMHKRGSLLKNAKSSGLLGPVNVRGDASVSVDLNGFPRGTKATASASGLFKQVTLNRGRPMAMASEDA